MEQTVSKTGEMPIIDGMQAHGRFCGDNMEIMNESWQYVSLNEFNKTNFQLWFY